jgi:rare lipoprotein A
MRHRVTTTVAFAVFASALVPAIGAASSGGVGVTGNGPAKATANVQSGNITVSATAGGITLDTRASALLRRQLTFSGNAPRADAGKTIEIERLGHETGWAWAQTVIATVAHNGSFSAVWDTNHIGQFSIRALVEGAARAASAAPMVTVTVYLPAIATMYGPGFWGDRTACGEKLKKSMIGVANRTLRCGEKVSLYYRGRTMIVPVIDRGPYANGANWDLTEATDKALGIPGTATIGAVSLPPAPASVR